MMNYYVEVLVNDKNCNFFVNAATHDELQENIFDALERFSKEFYPDDEEACVNCFIDATIERIYVRIW